VRRTIRDGYLDSLSSLRPFVACSPAELRAIGRGSTPVARRAGAVLARQGQLVREFLVLASGSAVVVRDDAADAVLLPGDWFGDDDLLSKRAASATVIALSDVEVIVMASAEFSTLFDAVPTFRRRLVTALAARAT
jgi:CRP-like cAMP-binding protein